MKETETDGRGSAKNKVGHGRSAAPDARSLKRLHLCRSCPQFLEPHACAITTAAPPYSGVPSSRRIGARRYLLQIRDYNSSTLSGTPSSKQCRGPLDVTPLSLAPHGLSYHVPFRRALHRLLHWLHPPASLGRTTSRRSPNHENPESADGEYHLGTQDFSGTTLNVAEWKAR